jgi:UDPglucose--hexose-1-phosphate uridylyltransferase
MLPGLIEETPVDESPGWQVRVVPNKYPVLRPEAVTPRGASCEHTLLAGYGFHEVIIESPRHDADLADLTDVEISAALSAYHRRFVWLASRPRIQSVILFRNHGPASGASLVHPHAQVIALDMTPPALQSRADWAQARYRDCGRCVICDELEFEQKAGRRVVAENDLFIALVPFAATCPFELRLIPKRHQASFAQIDQGELIEFGALLQGALRRLKTVLGDSPYNFAVHSTTQSDIVSPDQHWQLRIAPSLITPGGFELAADMPINPSNPEDDSEALRNAGDAASDL